MNFTELLKKPNLIAAHRGASALYPENTMLALRKSVGHCDFIEVDVALSSDGLPFIIHDETLERTTDVSELDVFKHKKPYRVYDFTFEELKSLDFGSWFYKGKKGLNTYEPILSLRDTLEFIKEKELFINIEIKDMNRHFSDEKVVNRVLQEIKEFEVQSQVMISSFRHAYLPLCKKIAPMIPTAAIIEDNHPPHLIEYLKELGVDAYHFNKEIVDEKIVKELKNAGFFIGIYVVNTKQKANQLFKMGINAIFSDIITKMV